MRDRYGLTSREGGNNFVTKFLQPMAEREHLRFVVIDKEDTLLAIFDFLPWLGFWSYLGHHVRGFQQRVGQVVPIVCPNL